MKTSLLTAAAVFLISTAYLAVSLAEPVEVEASFDTARLKDDLSGTLADPAKEVRVRAYVSAGSSLSVTLSSLAADGAPIAGMALRLTDEAGVDQLVAGSAFDKSVPGSGVISWKKVPLQATGAYSLILSGTSGGDWRMTLAGAMASLNEKFASTVDLGVNAEATVQFHGLRGGSLSYSLAAANGSKFKGELVRIERPDGSTIEGLAAAAKAKVLLDADGLFSLVFRNAGNGLGAWTAKTPVKPGKLLKRRGYVRPAGTALVPKVTSVSPASGFNKDDAAVVTLTGRDFQEGADVRLVSNGEQDIIATGVTVDSETQVRCTLNLDTAPVTGSTSVGVWNVGVWNAPAYTMPGDPKTLVKDSPTSNTAKTFNSLNSGAITLPRGVTKATEVWQLHFNDEFQNDLNRMGLGSADATTERYARDAVKAYVLCFLRDLMLQNETTGKLPKSSAPAISFVIDSVPNVAGKPGEDYNRIEIGGPYEAGDDRDTTEPLLWGFAPLDPGNTHRDDLTADVSDDLGNVTRVGHGARTRVLDPGASAASALWIAAMAPLRQTPLTAADRKYFLASFRPATVGEANRYRDIVNQITRASREIAAIVAHHIGRSMGLSAGGLQVMANPDASGNSWPVNGSLAFVANDITLLTANAVPHQLPGSSKDLTVSYFPFLSTQPSFLKPDMTAATPYTADWNYVGGRANAKLGDYTVKFASTLDYGGVQTSFRGSVTVDSVRISITNTPVYLDQLSGLPYGGISYFRIQTTDSVRGGTTSFLYRLNVYPNFTNLPTSGNSFIKANELKNYINSN